jgi:phosphoribosyl 1,2-cyclic phosphodiesterase
MSPTELLVRVNGIQAAFGAELGTVNPRAEEVRATNPYRQANVSFSLLQRHHGEIVRHTLIDVGMGVVPSLLEFEHTHGVHVVHEVFLTHPHFDHFAQLDWLSMCIVRNGRTDQPRPLPVYASQACWDNGPNHVFRHLAERSDFRRLESGMAVNLLDMAITPFSVDHGANVSGALGFVVQHQGRKVIFTGDFLRVVDEDSPLFFNADVAFMDANTWHPAERTAHQSVVGDLRLIEHWKPKRTYLVHYSGYEDRDYRGDAIDGPMSSDRFCRELERRAGHCDVQPARHGMILGEDVAWPA